MTHITFTCTKVASVLILMEQIKQARSYPIEIDLYEDDGTMSKEIVLKNGQEAYSFRNGLLVGSGLQNRENKRAQA